MRVMLGVSDWPGHWFAMVPLGWALQSAGHEVRVVCAPSQSEPVARAGLTPVPVLDGWEMTFQARIGNYLNWKEGRWPFTAAPPHPLTGVPLTSIEEFDLRNWIVENNDRLQGMARRSTDAAVAFGRDWRPDLILHDLLSLEGLLTARVLGTASALHLWGPAGTDEQEPGLKLLPLDMSQAFQRHGVGEVSFDHVSHVIDPCPADLAPRLLPAERLPVRFVPYNGPGGLPGTPEEQAGALAPTSGRPRVCVVWGTSVTSMFGDASFAVPKIVEALAGLDVEVTLAVTGADRQRIGELPPGVRLLEQAPLHLLLPGCDLVVHHGGAGCVMTSLAAGVPQLALPNGVDQPMNARRLAAAGVGRALPNPTADAASIRAEVAGMLADPSYAAAAARVRAGMTALPTPADLVPRLEKLASQ
ncbi:DUF1205 domain-containing protein [Streptomyces sp. BG9H]|uniref:DUF1205 domain-containing protein n=2 Tax=Streptomyces anatolicus TaxID=2675858 RepID=A0ABS6YVS5_9ACTN|nr:DUF1205 domain-containing protein [Streptomyces anatolicus]